VSDWQEYLKFRDGFLSILDPRFYSAEWLDTQVAAGSYRLWTNDDAAILATIRFYPAGAMEVHGVAATGDLEAIRALIPLAEDWGRSLGCIIASIESTPVWARILKDDGYMPYQLNIRKEL